MVLRGRNRRRRSWKKGLEEPSGAPILPQDGRPETLVLESHRRRLTSALRDAHRCTQLESCMALRTPCPVKSGREWIPSRRFAGPSSPTSSLPLALARGTHGPFSNPPCLYMD